MRIVLLCLLVLIANGLKAQEAGETPALPGQGGTPVLPKIGPTPAAPEALTVALPPGETLLSDVGMYRVGYQSYGGEVVYMPDSWVGHFEPVAGVSYMPGEMILGRSALLIHSPWHIPPGRTFVDYRLKLPKLSPISVSFGISMLPEVAVPDKSDGVTFGVYLIDKTGEQEFMREHYELAKWKDQTFDISICAGETVTLRLQVEPGPKNSPSFDYSYFGEPKIVCGAAGEGRRQRLAELTGTKAYKATEGKDLRALANKPGQGVTPSNLLPCKNTVAKVGNAYVFTYDGADGKIVYRYEPKTGVLDDVNCSVDGGAAFLPASGGGVFADVKDGEKAERARLAGGKAKAVEVKGGELAVQWEYALGGKPVTVDWVLGLKGKALTVRAECKEPVLRGLSLGSVGPVPLRRIIRVPYLPVGTLFYLPAQNLYVNRYLDWTVSQSSRCPQGEAVYDPKTDGTLNPMLESGYVAVSPMLGEVLPNIPWEPSPYVKLLGDKLMLDIWGHHKGTYAGDGENLRALKDNGVDHMAIINHVWQRWGYDVKLPDHIPANPDFGGDEGMIEFGKAANECGYVWSLHENYIDLYPDAPSYDETACVIRSDGTKSPAWYNAGTKVQSYGLKCNRALEYAKQNSPIIHDTYKTNAAYLDVHTCVPPWHQLDHQADQPMAAMALGKVQHDGELFQYMRDTHGGPLFGEGNNQFHWAGKVDGVEAQVSGGEDHTPLLDLDLLKLHPQMVNHGMGYYERWFRGGYDTAYGRNAGNMEDLDKYRAQTLAYGHVAFIGSISTDNVQWVAKEHNLCYPVSRLCGAAKPTSILYDVEGKLAAASVAVALEATSRQRIEYDSGLVLFVNWGAEPWKVGEIVLPQWALLASGPETIVFTTQQNGKWVDYAECPEYAFADARTSFNLPYVNAAKDVEPRLKAMEYAGGNKVNLTYEWRVNDTFEEDLNSFVHFTSPQVTQGDHIVFQNDHQTPKPTTQWQKGEVLVDGPHEVEIPEGTHSYYDITIGLWKGARASLKGIDDGSQRIVIGRLKVTREEGKVTGVTLADMAEVKASYPQQAEIDFGARLNPAGTLVNINKITTDGAVKVNREKDRLVVFPYPREKKFTVGLDLKGLAPGAKIEAGKVKVTALAAGTGAEMGTVEAGTVEGRLRFEVGGKGVGRYVVTW